MAHKPGELNRAGDTNDQIRRGYLDAIDEHKEVSSDYKKVRASIEEARNLDREEDIDGKYLKLGKLAFQKDTLEEIIPAKMQEARDHYAANKDALHAHALNEAQADHEQYGTPRINVAENNSPEESISVHIGGRQ